MAYGLKVVMDSGEQVTFAKHSAIACLGRMYYHETLDGGVRVRCKSTLIDPGIFGLDFIRAAKPLIFVQQGSQSCLYSTDKTGPQYCIFDELKIVKNRVWVDLMGEDLLEVDGETLKNNVLVYLVANFASLPDSNGWGIRIKNDLGKTVIDTGWAFCSQQPSGTSELDIYSAAYIGTYETYISGGTWATGIWNGRCNTVEWPSGVGSDFLHWPIAPYAHCHEWEQPGTPPVGHADLVIGVPVVCGGVNFGGRIVSVDADYYWKAEVGWAAGEYSPMHLPEDGLLVGASNSDWERYKYAIMQHYFYGTELNSNHDFSNGAIDWDFVNQLNYIQGTDGNSYATTKNTQDLSKVIAVSPNTQYAVRHTISGNADVAIRKNGTTTVLALPISGLTSHPDSRPTVFTTDATTTEVEIYYQSTTSPQITIYELSITECYEFSETLGSELYTGADPVVGSGASFAWSTQVTSGSMYKVSFDLRGYGNDYNYAIGVSTFPSGKLHKILVNDNEGWGMAYDDDALYYTSAREGYIIVPDGDNEIRLWNTAFMATISNISVKEVTDSTF